MVPFRAAACNQGRRGSWAVRLWSLWARARIIPVARRYRGESRFAGGVYMEGPTKEQANDSPGRTRRMPGNTPSNAGEPLVDPKVGPGSERSALRSLFDATTVRDCRLIGTRTLAAAMANAVAGPRLTQIPR